MEQESPSRFADPQFVRLSTILAEISCRFTSDDENGSNSLLPPARKIGFGRRALTGLLTSAQKTPSLGAFESALERDLYILLEFDRRVIAWHPQPLTIPVPGDGERRATRYTPDVAIEYSATPKSKEVHRVELCEVKYRDELRREWQNLKHGIRAGLRYAKSQGWSFKIYTEKEIRTPRLTNAKFFLGYVERGTDAMDIARLKYSLEALGVGTPNRLFEKAVVDTNEKGRMLGVLWHMIATGRVAMDFDKPLTMQTPIWCPEDEREFRQSA